MPKFEENVSLKAFNTLGIEARARMLAHCGTADEIAAAADLARSKGLPLLVLGGGSNLLLTRDFPGLVLRVENRGVTLLEDAPEAFLVRAAAGENWHAFVLHALKQGWTGLENLSLIPGTVGAAPIQNIGAYGVELDSVCDCVDALEISTGRRVTLDRKACRFAYRDSVFKHEARDRHVILSVTFRLPKQAPLHTGYAELRDALAARGIDQPNANDVSDAVIAIRRAKLPDPAVLGNAGSFFKNPLVSAEQFAALKVFHPRMVGYPQPGGAVKLAAGWLIDNAGWKGRALGGAAVYERQALVIVNRGAATADDVVALARAIQADIRGRFGVELEPEPVWV